MRFPVFLSVFLIFSGAALAANSDGTLPDPVMTPGDVRTSDKTDICTTKTSTIRNVPGSLKNRIRQSYGMKSKRDLWCNTQEGCEIDHLISLQLGGSNDPKNLWPQPYQGMPWNAHVKDQLENKMHRLICAGKISPEQAQHEIATNWIEAYKKYVSPEPIQRNEGNDDE